MSEEKRKKISVPNVSDGTMKDYFVGKNGELIEPALVEAEERAIAEAKRERSEEELKKQAQVLNERVAKAQAEQAAQDKVICDQLPALTKRMEVAAQIRKANFDAHLKMGFTPDQALAIVLSLK